MRIGILGQRGGWHEKSLQAALSRHGIDAPSLPITRLTARQGVAPRISIGQEVLDNYDALFIRAIPGGSLEEIIFRVDALHCLENRGVLIVNSPGVIERTVDKYYTLSLLEDAGIQVPRTIVTEHFDEAMNGFFELGQDIVVKPLFGSEGRGMVRVCDKETAYRAFRALELGRYVYCLQEFIPHGCEDIRTFVVGDRVVGAMVRRSETWKTNMAQGAKGSHMDPDDTLREMSLMAAKTLGAAYAGIDILPVEGGGYRLIEINGIPAWRGLYTATGINPAEHMVDFVLNKVR